MRSPTSSCAGTSLKIRARSRRSSVKSSVESTASSITRIASLPLGFIVFAPVAHLVRLDDGENPLDIENRNQPALRFGYALEKLRLRAAEKGREVRRRLEVAPRSVNERERAIDDEAEELVAERADEDGGLAIPRPSRERDAPTHVDRRYDAAAQVENSGDERRGVGERRQFRQRNDFLHVLNRQGVDAGLERKCQQDEFIRHG